jgi:hypothetical protein
VLTDNVDSVYDPQGDSNCDFRSLSHGIKGDKNCYGDIKAKMLDDWWRKKTEILPTVCTRRYQKDEGVARKKGKRQLSILVHFSRL